MTESPKPVLAAIGVIALALIAAEFYVGYYAMTAKASYEHPAIAKAPAQPALPTTPAPAQPHT